MARSRSALVVVMYGVFGSACACRSDSQLPESAPNRFRALRAGDVSGPLSRRRDCRARWRTESARVHLNATAAVRSSCQVYPHHCIAEASVVHSTNDANPAGDWPRAGGLRQRTDVSYRVMCGIHARVKTCMRSED